MTIIQKQLENLINAEPFDTKITLTKDFAKCILQLLKKQQEEIEDLKQTMQSMMEGICLLRDQEAVKPRISTVEQRCGNCNKIIEMDGWKACPWCGKPILWKGNRTNERR